MDAVSRCYAAPAMAAPSRGSCAGCEDREGQGLPWWFVPDVTRVTRPSVHGHERRVGRGGSGSAVPQEKMREGTTKATGRMKHPMP